MYKEATKIGLRFNTTVGVLTVEQLWQLSQSQLSSAIKAVKKVLKKNDDDELSFLEDTKVQDTENELRFNLLKDVYLTKKAEMEAIRTEADKKAHNEKIITLIKQKQDEGLAGKTIEELEALLQ